MEDGEGDEEGEEGGVKSSWYKDELKVIGKDQKGSMKKLYKDKIACITLKKSYYKDRHLVFFVNYPDYVVESYKKLDKLPIKLPKESSPEYLNIIEEDSNRVGVTLYYPHPDSLVKFTPYTFMKRFSVPFAKVGKSYKTIKYIMKNNGFILTQAKKYNFCWGFSKHRKQVYVVGLSNLRISKDVRSFRTSLVAGRSEERIIYGRTSTGSRRSTQSCMTLCLSHSSSKQITRPSATLR